MDKIEADFIDSSLPCGLGVVVPHTPPPARPGRGSQEGGKGGEVVSNDGGEEFYEIGKGDLAQGRDKPPLLRTARPWLKDGAYLRCDGMDEEPRSTAIINDGCHRTNKVVSSSSVDEGMIKGKCKGKKYRIIAKGPASCGSSCCKGA